MLSEIVLRSTNMRILPEYKKIRGDASNGEIPAFDLIVVLVLEQLHFFSRYGVEIGLLIETFEKFGLSAIAQVDLLERVHHNQSLEALSKMSFQIHQAVMRRLENRYGQRILEDVNKTMKLIRFEGGNYYLEVEEVAERERPPMIELPEYRAEHGLSEPG